MVWKNDSCLFLVGKAYDIRILEGYSSGKKLTPRQPWLYKPSLAPYPSSPPLHTPPSLRDPTRRNLRPPPRNFPERARGSGRGNPGEEADEVRSRERGGEAIRPRRAWRGGHRRRGRGW